ncbi:MAG: tetratricopeptide repeat protein [bacterium]
MKKTLVRFCVLTLLVILFSGCVIISKNLKRSSLPLSKWYEIKALEYENRGELQSALLCWRIVKSQNPDDKKISDTIDKLEAYIKNKADEHFRIGITNYRNKSLDEARKEFLIAIRLNPNHKEALLYLKKELTYEEYTTYKVEKDDTYEKISRKIYKNPGRSFIIAHFNDRAPQEKPVPGELLKIPLLDERFTRPSIDVEKELIKAKDLLNLDNYKETLRIIEKIHEYFPENKDATHLKNQTYLQLGILLKEQEDYIQSLNMLNKVDPSYKDIQDVISEVKKLKKAQADMHYNKGVIHFVNDQLKEAIEEWEKTLALNPEDERAIISIKQTRNLLEKLESIK